MDPAAIFIILLIIGMIIIVIWFSIILKRRRTKEIEMLQGDGSTAPPSAGAGQSQTGWTKEQPVPGQRGMCALYTFPAVSPGQPSIPTMNTQILDSLTPTEIGNVACFDADQLALQKVNQTCQGNSINGNFCYGTNAIIVQPGQNRQFYVECNSTKCDDTLAVTALNFDPTDFTDPPAVKSACLQFNSSDPSQSITGEVCDLTNNGQILRIERQNPNGTASDSGVYGRLVDRTTNLCVVPSAVPPTVGTTLQLGSCAPSNGYVWWFFPPSNIITDRTITEDGKTFTIPSRTTAPQQLVYYPNNGKQPPKGQDLNDFITKNQLVSISVAVNTDGTSATFGDTIYGQAVTMQNLSTNNRNNTTTGVVGSAPNAQTIDYWLYKTISQTPVTCLECGTNFTF